MRTNARAVASVLGLSAVILVAVFGTVACQSGEQADTRVEAERAGTHTEAEHTGTHTEGEHTGTHTEGEHTGTHTEGEQVTMYTCPMHPEVMSEEPGKCPECGMNLVEVGSEGAE